MYLAVLMFGIFLSAVHGASIQATDLCYRGRAAQLCKPPLMTSYDLPFVTAQATNTCGVAGPHVYYYIRERAMCDATNPEESHPVENILDGDPTTWWQSETLEGLGTRHTPVNIVINFGRTLDVSQIRITFRRATPATWGIYKKTSEDSPWIPYQYYSNHCEAYYGTPANGEVTPEDETQVLCTDRYSPTGYSTLGATVDFSPLDGRPSANTFWTSDALREFATATSIKISLRKVATYGDELYGTDNPRLKYWFAISEVVVSGRCHCNGHASECTSGPDGGMTCQCRHNTVGDDCERCDVSHSNVPWQPATADDGHACQ